MFNLTTVTHKSSDFAHPLVLLTNREGYKFLFGKIPEGSQRIMNESRFRLGKLNRIFLTGTVSSWAEIGGLPGLFLTISDATKNSVELFTGSEKITSFIVATWRYFVFRHGVQLNIREIEETSFVGDSTMTINPVKIQSSEVTTESNEGTTIFGQLKKLVSLMFPIDTRKVNDPSPDSYKSDPSENDIHTHVKLPQLSSLGSVNSQPSMSLILRFLPVRGKFDPVAAKRLGVKPGIAFRNLTNGDSVVGENGEVVHPHQVIEPSKSFRRVLILDIPNSTYLSNSINSEKWFEATDQGGSEPYGVVYHFLGDDIDFDLEQYVNFIKKFPSDCKHLISHSKIANDSLMFTTANVNTLTLKSIQNDHFNLPYCEEYKPIDTEASVQRLHSLQQVNIDPNGVTIDNSSIQKSSLAQLYDEKVAPLHINGCSKEELLQNPVISLDAIEATSLKDQVQVVTLGTGSAIPSIHRNVISSLVRIPYNTASGVRFRSILLDGGENTFGLMKRNFGHNNQKQLQQVFEELCLIHLSHLHADHHLGLVSILNHWFKVNSDPSKKIYLIVPWQYNTFLKEWYEIELTAAENVDFSRIVYFSCQDFLEASEVVGEFGQVDIGTFEERYEKKQSVAQRLPVTPANNARIKQMYDALGIESINTVRAIHCYWAYSISIKFKLDEMENFKVSYSGDTRPNSRFVECGYNSDLLIHESSLDSELIEEAIAKKHSTMIEAIKVSQLMKCPKLILTHFSTRYAHGESMYTDNAKLEKLASDMKEYLDQYNPAHNIFNYRPMFGSISKMEDVLVCFAFDCMTIRYKNLDAQKLHYEDIMKVFSYEESRDKVKKDKELQKKKEKKETRRNQRLTWANAQKKRKVSSDEEEGPKL